MAKEQKGILASFLGSGKSESKRKQQRHNKAHMARGVCIYCDKAEDTKPKFVSGYPIKEDYVIAAIRWVKRKTHTEQGNPLVVCEKHIEEHLKKRGGFERSLIIYGGIGIFMTMLLLVMNLSIGSLVAGLLFLIFLLAIAHMRYVPKTEGI
ncbi:MAG: hypothetical protein QXS93_02785 [Candidatus Micrarchaeia archaeon]